MNAESSTLVEIPRLDVNDKISIQLQFLSHFPGIWNEEKLRLAAEAQEDGQGFVLDKLLGHHSPLNPMEPYWEDFKLKSIQYYLETYTGLLGIAGKLTG